MKVSLTRFGVSSAVFVSAAAMLTAMDGLEPLQRLTALAAAALAGAFGATTTVVGASIVTAAGPLDIATACLPLGMTAVFVALVVSTDTGMSRRVVGILLALAVALVANVVRLAILVWSAQRDPQAFGSLHQGLLQMLPEVLVFMLWLAWSETEQRPKALKFLGVTLAISLAISLAWPALSSAYMGVLRMATPTSGEVTQAIASSPWLIVGLAVIAAARAKAPARVTAIAWLMGSVVVADLALGFLAPLLSLDPYQRSLAQGSLTVMAPVIAVVLFVHGRPSELWRPETATAHARRAV